MFDEQGHLFTGRSNPGLSLDTRIRSGILQLGLDDDEIESFHERIEDVIDEADKGDVAIY